MIGVGYDCVSGMCKGILNTVSGIFSSLDGSVDGAIVSAMVVDVTRWSC